MPGLVLCGTGVLLYGEYGSVGRAVLGGAARTVLGRKRWL